MCVARGNPGSFLSNGWFGLCEENHTGVVGKVFISLNLTHLSQIGVGLGRDGGREGGKEGERVGKREVGREGEREEGRAMSLGNSAIY